MVVPFHPPTPTRAPSSTRRWSSSDSQQQLLGLIDRYQVLVLRNPKLAKWLVEWLELFLRAHGR